VKRLIAPILLTFSLIGCADEQIMPDTASSEVFVINCTEAVSEPTELVLYCADAGQILTEITWASWGGETALGKGISVANTCEPSCAEGDFATVGVDLTLSGLVERDARLVYSQVSMIYSQPVNGVLEEIFELPLTDFK
jgi:hypothetical protein